MSIIDRIEKEKLAVSVHDCTRIPYEFDVKAYNELLRLAKIGERMQWISIHDEKPKVGQIVDVLSDGKRFIDMEVKQDNDGCFFDSIYEIYIRGINDITHWMPMPTPPKEAE